MWAGEQGEGGITQRPVVILQHITGLKDSDSSGVRGGGLITGGV